MVYHPPPPPDPQATLPKFIDTPSAPPLGLPTAVETVLSKAAPPASPAEKPTEPLPQEHRLTTIPQALTAYGHNIKPLATEIISTTEALHRCLAEAACSHIDLPSFTQSAMDGYAVRSADVEWASSDKPQRLRVIGEIAAGPAQISLPSQGGGTAYRIYTGARIPEHFDAVVPQEKVRVEGEYISLDRHVEKGRNVRVRAEEMHAGDTLSPPGQRVSPGMLAALMAAGAHNIKVFKRPRIRVLVTGDEVVPPGQIPTEGQVHDANGPLVAAWLTSMGYPVPEITYVRDLLRDLEDALDPALAVADVVLTTGGVSVGSRDYLPDAARTVGVRQVFWKVAQKPGRPLFFGMREKTVLLGLPGNPASVLVGLVFHARRVLDLLEGTTAPGPRLTSAKLMQAVKADPTRDLLLRMNLSLNPDGMIQLDPLPKQESHMLSNLATAMAMVLLPARERDYAAGERVLWTPLPGVTRI